MSDKLTKEQIMNSAMDLKEIQAEYAKRVAELKEKVYEGFEDMGAINVKMNGEGRVLSIDITPMYAQTHLSEQVGEAITKALNKCHDSFLQDQNDLAMWIQNKTVEVMRANGQNPYDFNLEDGSNE